MSIATELQRIQGAKADIKSAIEAKGVTVPSNALIDSYDTYIGQISGGGGGGQAEQDLKDLIERDITSVTIPSGTTSIGAYAFTNCTSLTTVSIPNTVTEIGNYAFDACQSLTSVTIPDSVTIIGAYVFRSCSGLVSLTISDNVTMIDASFCNGCSSLVNLTLPSGVTSIGQFAFQNTAITTLTLPSTISSIGNSAFSGCSSLTSITVEATIPPTLGSRTFNNTNNCPIYVPAESVSTYQSANNWSSLSSRIQAIPTV